MLQGIIILVSLQLLGEMIAYYFSLPIPGAILGMAILLLYLILKGGVSAALLSSSQQLFPYLPLLLIPASVGVIQYGGLLEKEGFAILAALIISLIISFVATPFIFMGLRTLFKSDKSRPQP